MDDLVPPNVSHTGADLPLLTPPVLVIEEDFTILEMVIRMLNLAGYSTIACTNRQKILAHLSSLRYFGMFPAVILLDLSLPLTNQSNILTYLQDIRSISDIPIIVLTTNLFIQKIVEDASYPVMMMPFHLQDLIHAVQIALLLSHSSKSAMKDRVVIN